MHSLSTSYPNSTCESSTKTLEQTKVGCDIFEQSTKTLRQTKEKT